MMVKMNLVYPGTLYSKQNPGRLFQAVRELIDENKIPLDGIVINFYGTEIRWLAEPIQKFGLEDVVKINPRVSHSECLNIQRVADVLLLFDWDDMSCDPTGGNTKMYEYLPMSSTVLVVGCKNHSDMRNVIEGTYRGVYCNGVMEVKKVLRQWWMEEFEYDYNVENGLL